jgi:hypothetical protein
VLIRGPRDAIILFEEAISLIILEVFSDSSLTSKTKTPSSFNATELREAKEAIFAKVMPWAVEPGVGAGFCSAAEFAVSVFKH